MQHLFDYDTITLFHEKLEALRLVDLEGRYQEDAARRMKVSRSTLQRMLSEACTKVVQAPTDGSALHIEGGTFRVATKYWQCSDCGHLREIEHGSVQRAPARCPSCGSHVIHLRRIQRKRAHP